MSEATVSLVVHGSHETREYPLEPGRRVTIGADPSNDVVIGEDGVQPRHAAIEWDDEGPAVVDVAAPTDVFLNGQRVARGPLENGDFIKLGTARLVFHESAAVSGAALRGTVRGRVVRVVLESDCLRIGRGGDNDVVLDHPQVARRHARVERTAGGWTLLDEKDMYGTFLNGKRLDGAAPLQEGDRFTISAFHFRLVGDALEYYSEAGNARVDVLNVQRVAGGSRIILHDVSLSIYPREFVALVGASGAGKSTLMNALSGFRPADAGRVLLNGTDYYAHFDSFRASLGFVPQDDIIHRELTVERALHYAACLRLPEDSSEEERAQRINEVLHDLHLTERRDTPIANLSGGQRKRVSIGVELLTRPRIFYLDEPTSGLDPGMETELMRIFRNLADKGHTLVIVTHATKNITLCNKIAFMAEGGYLAFYGSPQEALEFFRADDFSDIYLKIQNERTPEQWQNEYRASPYYQRNVGNRLAEVEALAREAAAEAREEGAVERAAPRASALRQYGILTRRALEIHLRDRGNLGILMGSALLIALLIPFLFPDPNLLQPFVFADFNFPPAADGPRDPSSITDNYGKARQIVFFTIIAAIFFGVNNAIREIAREIPIYRRERTVNLQIPPYVFSKLTVMAALCLTQVALLTLVIGFHLKVPEASPLFYAKLLALLWLGSLAAMAMALAFSAFASNENKAGSALPVLIIPQIFLTGIFPRLTGTAALVTNFGLTKWMYETLHHHLRLWNIFPSPQTITNPQVGAGLQMMANDASVDCAVIPCKAQMALADLQDLIDAGAKAMPPPGYSYLHYMTVLLGFFVFFTALTCWFQKRKDWQRD